MDYIKVKINKYDKIIKGDYEGQFIFIQDDKENTGGYLILISKEKKSDIGYDSWVEKYEDLKQYFLESKWKIEWEKSVFAPTEIFSQGHFRLKLDNSGFRKLEKFTGQSTC